MGLSGGVAEWFKAAALKAVSPRGLVGSNPTASSTQPFLTLLMIQSSTMCLPDKALFFKCGDVTEWPKVLDC